VDPVPDMMAGIQTRSARTSPRSRLHHQTCIHGVPWRLVSVDGSVYSMLLRPHAVVALIADWFSGPHR
jgi:hypothetical protein